VSAPVVVRRWCGARGAGAPGMCSSCGGAAVTGEPCPTCGELAAPLGLAGHLEVLTTIAGRRRLVTLERSPEGGWEPLAIGRQAIGRQARPRPHAYRSTTPEVDTWTPQSS
jgi:hypothetical protein